MQIFSPSCTVSHLLLGVACFFCSLPLLLLLLLVLFSSLWGRRRRNRHVKLSVAYLLTGPLASTVHNEISLGSACSQACIALALEAPEYVVIVVVVVFQGPPAPSLSTSASTIAAMMKLLLPRLPMSMSPIDRLSLRQLGVEIVCAVALLGRMLLNLFNSKQSCRREVVP